jgi:hypothetical protein
MTQAAIADLLNSERGALLSGSSLGVVHRANDLRNGPGLSCFSPAALAEGLAHLSFPWGELWDNASVRICPLKSMLWVCVRVWVPTDPAG